MRALILPVLCLGLANPSPRFISSLAHDSGSSDSLDLELTSTVPGREVRFTVRGSQAGAQLVAAGIELRAESVFATTPARLRIRYQTSTDDLVLQVVSGEPWLHGVAERSVRLDLWGDKFTIRRTTGRPMLLAPVLRSEKAVPR
jgi:hypothetical protein